MPVLLLLLLALLTGCGLRDVPAAPHPADTPAATSSGPVVPWALRLAAEQPPPSASGLFSRTPPGPPCRADDVRLRAEEPVREPAQDGQPERVAVTVLLENAGAAACALPPEAEGGLLDEDGDALLLASGTFDAQPAYAPPPPLEPGASASTRVTWHRWCGDDPGRWRVGLEQGEVRVPGDDPPVPPCTGDVPGSVHGLGLWTVLNADGQPARDPQSALVATVTGPDEGRLGGVLPMVLELRNPTRGPVALTPCPSFAWSVSRDGPGSFLRSSPPFALNCLDAPDAVPAGGSVRFALELVLSPSLADGTLAPGRWWVHPALLGTRPRPVTVLPAGPARPGPADCTFVPAPDGEPRVPGLPPRQAPRTLEQDEAVLRTSRGDVVVRLDPAAAPCAVASFLHHVRGGFWRDQPCSLLSAYRTFQHLDCGTAQQQVARAGFVLPAEVVVGQRYPAGSVLLSSNESLTHTASLRVLAADAPTYASNFTALGRVVEGLEVFQEVVAGGQRDGEYGGPRLPLVIRSVDLR